MVLLGIALRTSKDSMQTSRATMICSWSWSRVGILMTGWWTSWLSSSRPWPRPSTGTPGAKGCSTTWGKTSSRCCSSVSVSASSLIASTEPKLSEWSEVESSDGESRISYWIQLIIFRLWPGNESSWPAAASWSRLTGSYNNCVSHPVIKLDTNSSEYSQYSLYSNEQSGNNRNLSSIYFRNKSKIFTINISIINLNIS